MNTNKTAILSTWISQLSEFNKNDLLVHLDNSKVIPYNEEASLSDYQKIVSISQNSIKESGINTLCHSFGLLQWNYKNTVISTPVWLTPVSFQIDKVRNKILFSLQEEAAFINPFLVKKLKEIFDIHLTSENEIQCLDELKEKGFDTITTDQFIGNFHYHRHTIIRELDELKGIKLSNNLNQFLTGENYEAPIILPDAFLLPFDSDQAAIIEQLTTRNCVVQGPPGTGKSQLLSNVIGKALKSGYHTLVISEKRAALEVIVKRMQSVQLDPLCLLVNDNKAIKEIIQDLKQTWSWLAPLQVDVPTKINTRKELENNLQFTLDLLNQEQLIGEISYAQFQTLKGSNQLPTATLLLGEIPSLKEFINRKKNLESLFDKQLQQVVGMIPFNRWATEESEQLAVRLQKMLQLAKQMEKLEEHFTIESIEKWQREQATYQLFQNELVKKYQAILTPHSKEQKHFLKQVEKYKLAQLSKENIRLTEWNAIPSIIELEHLEKSIQAYSFWNKWKIQKHWSKYNTLPIKEANKSIQQLKKYLKIDSEEKQALKKLFEIGITDITELDIIKASLHLFSAENWLVYNQLNDDEKSIFEQKSTLIQQLKDELSYYYHLDKNTSVVSQLTALHQHFSALMAERNNIIQLNQAFLNTLKIAQSLEEYTNQLLAAHQMHFFAHYPTLAQFEPSQLKEKIALLQQAEQEEQQNLVATILKEQQQRFLYYEQIIQTPSNKLSQDEIALKKELKKGKSILVKEFSKTKAHPSLRHLLASEAKRWIQVLKPVWLSNPSQLGNHFPLEEELFDLCIIDEASQIPIYNSLGALHRSKRSIIAGDEQQMTPMTYFQSGEQQITSTLHHASYYFTNKTLRHHYRSKHPELIQFSNTHFYNNELIVFPSYPYTNSSIQSYFCEKGRFIHRKNEEEATKIAALVGELISKHPTDSIGIVAFSQEQLDCIISKLTPQQLEHLINEELNNFIKPLEKVQGDECQQLIISLGYAHNEEGTFQMHFGPLSTQSGRNRLNVLLSRASERIHFFHSIKASVLQWSENPSVELLYKWLIQLETTQTTVLQFPFITDYQIEGNQLQLNHAYTQLTSARELSTFVSVMEQRNWEVILK